MKSAPPGVRKELTNSKAKLPTNDATRKKPSVPLLFQADSEVAETFRHFIDTDFAFFSEAEIAKAHATGLGTPELDETRHPLLAKAGASITSLIGLVLYCPPKVRDSILGGLTVEEREAFDIKLKSKLASLTGVEACIRDITNPEWIGGATPPNENLKDRARTLTHADFILAAKAFGVSRETLHQIILETTTPRPKWRSALNEKPPELRGLSSIQFMLVVYDDLIEKKEKRRKVVETIVYKDAIRKADPDLMTTVEVYLNDRRRTKRDLGEAEGITFISSRPTRESKPKGKRAVPARQP